VLNFISTDLEMYKIFKITRVLLFGTPCMCQFSSVFLSMFISQKCKIFDNLYVCKAQIKLNYKQIVV